MLGTGTDESRRRLRTEGSDQKRWPTENIWGNPNPLPANLVPKRAKRSPNADDSSNVTFLSAGCWRGKPVCNLDHTSMKVRFADASQVSSVPLAQPHALSCSSDQEPIMRHKKISNATTQVVGFDCRVRLSSQLQTSVSLLQAWKPAIPLKFYTDISKHVRKRTRPHFAWHHWITGSAMGPNTSVTITSRFKMQHLVDCDIQAAYHGWTTETRRWKPKTASADHAIQAAAWQQVDQSRIFADNSTRQLRSEIEILNGNGKGKKGMWKDCKVK